MECPSCQAPLPEEALYCLRCGAKAAAPATVEPDDPIRAALRKALGQQYEIQRLLGRGGMGAVYLATEAALEREVAIKVLPPDRGATKDSRDRFRREARTAARLSHPNIVPLYTFGDVDGTLYFVMGYVKGESLAARLKREGRLPVEEARRLLIEIAEALDYAHKLGIVHRDIKPDNVLMEEGTGRAMLMDFGVAKALGAGQTMTEVGSVLGTPQYMSPEQAQGKADIDHRSDLYSLGVMGYAMLAGRLPFEGPTAGDVMVQHITKEAPSLKSLAPEIPAELSGALTRCLAKSRDDRWPDARGLKDAIGLKDDAGLPEEMAEARRDTQVVALAFYLSLLVAIHLATRSDDPDPATFQPPWETVFIGTAIGVVIWAFVIIQRRREGRSWREILGFAFSKPAWWVGWYPNRLRLRNDVWRRLPQDLRRARVAFWTFALVYAILLPPQLILMNAGDAYRRTGQKTPSQRFAQQVPRGVVRVAVVSVGLSVLGLLVVLIFSAGRWGRVVARTRTNRHLTNAMFFRDTAHPTFWSKPEVAALLLPVEPDGARTTPPASARDLVLAISTAATRLAGESATLGASARAAAPPLAVSIVALDGEIASLAGAVDPLEAERLVAKIEALGPPSPGEGDAKGQMRELFQKQLDLHRGVGLRLDALKALRSRKLELLRALWSQMIELQAAASNSARSGDVAGRMRQLLSRIDEQAAEAKTMGADGSGGTEAMSDAPTIAR